MERERIKLALEDRPVRSEFEALNELHEDRLKTTEAELRRLIAELSNRLQVSGVVMMVFSYHYPVRHTMGAERLNRASRMILFLY